MKTIKTNYVSQIKVNGWLEGQSIEERMRRVVETNEPIDDAAPMIYTDRKDGVLPEYDIRTDRFDVALDAMDKVHKSIVAKREERARIEAEKDNNNNQNNE